MSLTIHVTSAHHGSAWLAHLATELGARHPDADVRVERGPEDSAYVWDDDLIGRVGSAWSSDQLSAVVDATEAEEDYGHDSFAAGVQIVDDLGESVERECGAIFRAWVLASSGKTLVSIARKALGWAS